MEELYPLFFTNLEDNIPSVRQGAAIALANVVKAYGIIDEIFHFISNFSVDSLFLMSQVGLKALVDCFILHRKI